jgi:hypothetical protein
VLLLESDADTHWLSTWVYTQVLIRGEKNNKSVLVYNLGSQKFKELPFLTNWFFVDSFMKFEGSFMFFEITRTNGYLILIVFNKPESTYL